MNRNTYDLSTIILGVAGLVGIGYGICANSKLGKISKRLDKAIDDLADNTEIDIPEALVNEAVEKAVKAEAKRAVESATKESIAAFKKEIHSQVKSAVDEEYDNLKDSVLKEITAEAAKIDTNRVRRSVEESAKEAALKKFDDNLDDILEKFNDSLDNTSKIYSSIRDALTKDLRSDKEFVVRLN